MPQPLFIKRSSTVQSRAQELSVVDNSSVIVVYSFYNLVDLCLCESEPCFSKGSLQIRTSEVSGVIVVDSAECITQIYNFAIFACFHDVCQNLALETTRSREALQSLKHLDIQLILEALCTLTRFEE